jgi:hypothetical protein
MRAKTSPRGFKCDSRSPLFIDAGEELAKAIASNSTTKTHAIVRRMDVLLAYLSAVPCFRDMRPDNYLKIA